ncbi:MAG: hypothetical protein GWM87_12315 [Xanthomonadales bacterium]|nr:hypothetical protein [Xanthomonadales bacterium]NIX13627.1 hypothetical protein [Xanthomonadales bacterium]
MSTIRNLVIAAGLVLLGGCSAVYSPVPLGEDPLPLVAADWEGTWLFEGDIVKVRVTDAGQGKLRLLAIDGGELDVVDVHIRTSGGWNFISMPDEEDGEDPDSPDTNEDGQLHYAWGRIVIEGDQLIVWAPDVAKFRRLVREEKLPGSLVGPDGKPGDNVYLGQLEAAHYTLITSGEEGVLMDWDEPGVGIRVAK